MQIFKQIFILYYIIQITAHYKSPKQSLDVMSIDFKEFDFSLYNCFFNTLNTFTNNNIRILLEIYRFFYYNEFFIGNSGAPGPIGPTGNVGAPGPIGPRGIRGEVCLFDSIG